MGICSVVITTDEADPASKRTLGELAADHQWTLGDWRRGTLSAVLETESMAEDRRNLRWLDEQPGVVGVHLVFAYYGDDGEQSDDGDRVQALSDFLKSPPPVGATSSGAERAARSEVDEDEP
jgi:nitrate reductase NapAB chaperone NapD